METGFSGVAIAVVVPAITWLTVQQAEIGGYALNGEGYYAKDGEELAFAIIVHESFVEKPKPEKCVFFASNYFSRMP